MGALADLRTRVVLALAPTNGDTWNVQEVPEDSVTPPAYVLVWGDPWIEPATHCTVTARLEIVAVAHRVGDEPGVIPVEDLVEHAIGVLRAAKLPAVRTGRPGPYQVGAVSYYAARLTLTQPVSV